VKSPTDQALRIVGLVAVTLILGTCKGDMGDPGGTGPTGTMGNTGPVGPAGPNAAFKTVITPSLVAVAASPAITNIVALTFTAPSAGYVLATASGYCNVSVAAGVEWRVLIGLSATEGFSFPAGTTVWRFSGATAITGISLNAERVVAVVAGTNTLYLNVDNASGSAVGTCQGKLTALFTASQLP
jgi:hypothetical protein